MGVLVLLNLLGPFLACPSLSVFSGRQRRHHSLCVLFRTQYLPEYELSRESEAHFLCNPLTWFLGSFGVPVLLSVNPARGRRQGLLA